MAQVRANYEFWAENDAELSFQIGDIITVINRDDEGWWEGELNGRRGLFPSNYVEPYTAINNYRAGAGGANRFNNTNTNNTNNYQPSWASNNNNNNNNNNKWNNNNNNNNNNNWNNKTKPTTTPTTGGWNQQAQWARTDGDAAVITRVDNDWTSERGMPDAASAKFALKKPANLDTYNSILNAYNAPTTTETAQPVARAATTTSPKIEEPVKKPAAATTAFAPRAKVSPTKYGLWASNMGDMTGLSMIGMGICSIVWALVDVNRFGILCQYTGLYGIGMGLCVFLYENSRFGQTRGASRIPWRAIGYGTISIFQFFSLPMLMTALFCVIVAGVNLLSTVKGEVYDRTAKQSHGTQDNGYFSDLYSYLISIKEQNKIGVLVFMFAYFAANIVIFFVVLWDFIGQIAAAEAATGGNGPSYWIPYAKAFGNILDFNGSIIVLPVCRTFLRMLYNRSTADQGFFARCLRGVLYFIPIDKNLAFHKLIAKGILIGTVGHTIAHFLNFANAPTVTFANFGISPFLTGGILCVTVLLIFSAARDNTRRGQFEIFWYSHHTFVIFFVVQLFHGKGSINPNYWKWFAGPGTLYFLERCLRIYRANQKVVVLSVTMMDDVFSLEFAKEGVFEAPYMEGQYMFIQSPAISQIQWHPFTISSAPQEQSVTVHIRVQGEGSWTRGLREYIGAMGPRGKPYFQLDRQGPSGKLLGKILGPDGKPMLHIDGPHSAPTQHIGEYSAVIVAGAGIGVTPVAATLKSIVFHRWKYFIGQCFPDHAYFVWVCGHKDIHAFRWLVRHIKDAQDEVTHMRATNPQNMASKTFEFHIYVSSVPKDQKPVDVVVDDEVGFWGVPREDAKVDKVRCNWDEADLYKAMMCPTQHIELGDVHVWNGRPAWDPRFQAVSRNHPHMDIGVMFCGNPAIGKDLRRQCHIHSKGRSQGIFKLHKENF